jgi:lipoate-protein ligase A
LQRVQPAFQPSPTSLPGLPCGSERHFDTTAAGEQAWNADTLADRPSRPRARVWIWPQPAVVLGRAQQKRLVTVQAAVPELEVLVRGSGGGAVLAGPWMVGASVVMPAGHRLLGRALTDGYRWLGEVYLQLVSGLGVKAELLVPERVARLDAELAGGPIAWACFGGLSPWELTDARGRKLVGLAQQRKRDAVLLVSGLLVQTPPWALLCRALDTPGDEHRLHARTVSIEALLDQPIGAAAVRHAAAELDRLLGGALGDE